VHPAYMYIGENVLKHVEMMLRGVLAANDSEIIFCCAHCGLGTKNPMGVPGTEIPMGVSSIEIPMGVALSLDDPDPSMLDPTHNAASVNVISFGSTSVFE
ncbi:hypothetical protein ACJX0J_018492, partial [Zea mays]